MYFQDMVEKMPVEELRALLVSVVDTHPGILFNVLDRVNLYARVGLSPSPREPFTRLVYVSQVQRDAHNS